MSTLDSSRMFISYTTPYDHYVGTLDWNNLTTEQQDQILVYETSGEPHELNEFIMSTGLKKKQAGGIRSILVGSAMILEKNRMIADATRWDKHQLQLVLILLDGTLLAKRIAEALSQQDTQIRTPIDGEILASLAQTNMSPSVLDATLDMNFADAKTFLLDHLQKMQEANRTFGHIDKMKILADQKRLMSAYYEDIPVQRKPTLVERLLAIFYSWRWVMEDNVAPRPPNSLSAEQKFANEMSEWPQEQKDLIFKLLYLVVEQDHKRVFELLPKIDKVCLNRTIEYVKVMKKPPLKKTA